MLRISGAARRRIHARGEIAIAVVATASRGAPSAIPVARHARNPGQCPLRAGGERLTRVSRFGHLALHAGDPDDGRMWRRWRREPPLEARDVQTMMDVLFDLRSDTTEILRILGKIRMAKKRRKRLTADEWA